jgi:GTP-binding protein HflX
LFERPQAGETAILVQLDLTSSIAQNATTQDFVEFEQLALAAGAKPAASVRGARRLPSAKYFVGAGKAEEIKAYVTCYKADLVIFNHDLTPAQERNLERLLSCRVVDRRGLILDIFAQRARTFEGKLQVELAQLQHLSTRLVRGWTHLERQKGGIGLRGPGETQLETDRRLVRIRLKTLQQRLEKVRLQRQYGRQARAKANVPTVVLVGYTNAGKSTLFKSLTAAPVYIADQLFATLDPTLRRIQIAEIGAVVLADTVGFIRDLPHDLIAAFRATLEETLEASLLLHVIDAAAPQREANIEQVEQVLEQIGANAVPRIQIYNKIDLLPDQQANKTHISRNQQGKIKQVWLSAAAGMGLDLLMQALTESLGQERICQEIVLNPQQGKLRALLYAQGAILRETTDTTGNYLLTVRMPKADWQRLLPNARLH